MALKKLKKYLVDEEDNSNKKEEIKNMGNISNETVNGNIVTGDENVMKQNEAIEKVEKTIEDVSHECTSYNKQDLFLNTEELIGTSTPVAGLEIELKVQLPMAEGRYEFYIKNLNIEEQVETKYGIKNKLVTEFHISRTIDGQDFVYDLKQKYNISGSRKSRFYQLFTDLTGEAPVGKINLRKLLGVKGLCEVKHISLDNGDIFPRIVNINAELHKNFKNISEI